MPEQWDYQKAGLDLKKYEFTCVRLDYDHATTAQRIRDAGLDPSLASRLSRGR